jgi:hypothetical protein
MHSHQLADISIVLAHMRLWINITASRRRESQSIIGRRMYKKRGRWGPL